MVVAAGLDGWQDVSEWVESKDLSIEQRSTTPAKSCPVFNLPT